MIYIVCNPAGEIITYGTQHDWGDPADTVEMIDTTLDEYARRFVLASDKPQIAADGLDIATVNVIVPAAPTSVNLLVNGAAAAVALAAGVGTLQVVADIPGNIVIEPADRTLYCAAGLGTLVIGAE